MPTRLWGFSGHFQTLVQGIFDHVYCPLVNGKRFFFVRQAVAVQALPGPVWLNPPEDRSQVGIHLAQAKKVSLPSATTTADEGATGSRSAKGDERTKLVLDAVVTSSHSG